VCAVAGTARSDSGTAAVTVPLIADVPSFSSTPVPLLLLLLLLLQHILLTCRGGEGLPPHVPVQRFVRAFRAITPATHAACFAARAPAVAVAAVAVVVALVVGVGVGVGVEDVQVRRGVHVEAALF